MNTFEVFLINPATLCYMRMDKPFALRWRTKMGWHKTSKTAYDHALTKGWVEYMPGRLRPPAAQHPAAPGEG